MPFKLKLKKTRQYNVVSKNLFVISVELLDGVVVECTLSADSSGQECLDNVCQRLVIDQPEFFGLRYINRQQQLRWVHLDRPLKRQLDKYASSHQLYLRVMYYVISGTSLITDEVTRYHYFLQLKNDLIEGRIVCDCQQAVVLASYSRQAEYGNLDRERHTVEYLKNLLQFPKQMVDGGQIIDGNSLAETGRLEWLTASVIQHHLALYNMSQAQAEEGYISACQLLSGYGQETFVAKDQLKQSEVMLAISLTGIMVASEACDTPHIYRWTDITNVINHKRTFSIECATPADSATFILPTPEDGNYIWRMCVLQHTFYMKHQTALLHSAKPNDENQPKFQEHGLSESREELDMAGSGPLGPAQRAHSTSCLELMSEAQPQQQVPARPHSHHLRALLPSYRAAPDYETAIQQKYQEQRAQVVRYPNHHAHSHSRMVTNPKPLLYGSHPDIHRPVHYPDVTRHTVSVNQAVGNPDDYSYMKLAYTPFALNPNVQTDLNPQLQYINVYKPPPPYPSNGLASNSTPDLAVASQALAYHRGYINSHVSGSSPDLVSTRSALSRQYLGYLHGGNAHNVVNYGRVANVMPSAHGTYNNLASVIGVPNPHVILDPHHISDNIQKVYDERGNIMYSMPMHRVPYQRHVVLSQGQHAKITDTEPIYENVPLPWQNDRTTIRDRAQSLTETDEMSRIMGRNSSQPTISQTNMFGERLNVNYAPPPSIKVNPPYDDNHYVNAQIIQGVRNSSVPKDLNVSTKSINEDVEMAFDRLSLTNANDDDTPYQSLSTQKNVSNNNTLLRLDDNVTSITVSGPDIRRSVKLEPHNNSGSSGVESVTNSSALNSTQFSSSLDLDSSANTTKSSSVSTKEKKRRRWGMFIGRASKNVEVKSATLGRDRSKQMQPPSAATKHRWSTGLPKMQPLPPSITKETLCQLLERKMSDTQLSFAFEQIAKGRDSNGDMTTALCPENSCYNGFSSEHLPYEDNRVRLNPSPVNRHGYINASHITMTVGSSQRFYVIGRAPTAHVRRPPKLTSGTLSLDAECALWWECVWQVGARVVVLVAGDSQPPYLPEEGATKQFGKLSVQTECRQASSFGYTCRARVRCADKPPRRVWHVHYAHWTDAMPVPDSPADFLSFLSEVGGLRQACAYEPAPPHSGNAPVVVGCAHGAGRSGTALAADLLLHTLDHNQELDLPRTVGLLHQQRSNMIQNVHQYRFLHKILLQYLKQSRLI